ncbi:MAG: GNAT family N-acetyltransferase [Clostridia bacterium]|nr:GNAT family N-acetyltransferase [Clostridia bacterium]
MQIEEMRIEDYDDMLELWQNTPGMGLSRADDKDEIAMFLKHNPGLCFTCSELGRIVGTILCGFDGRRGYLYHLAVDKAYRHRGLGKALVHKSLEALSKKGVEKCHLFVFKDNALGRGFWENTGWKQREDIVVFSKDVGGP